MKLSGFLPRFIGVMLIGLVVGLATARAQANLPHAAVGASYQFQVTITPAAPTGTLYSATGLPTGVLINASSGLISGTPTTATTATGVIRLDYPSGLSDQFNYTLVVDPPTGTSVISSATAASGTVGQAFTTYTVTASIYPISFNVGTLPAGLSLGGTTVAPTISGTPTTAGTFAVTLSANNANGTGPDTTLTITIAPAGAVPVITSATAASAALNASFSYAITASGSPTSYSVSGALPFGLTLDANSGTITGKPTVAGIYTVSLSATNGFGSSATRDLTLTVGDLPAVTSGTSATGNVGAAFSYQAAATNSPTSFNVTGTLPAGLTANATTGLISGTPTAAGTTNITVSANNALGTGATVTVAFVISPAVVSGGGGGGGSGGSAPVITTQPASQSVTAGGSATFTVVATGGMQYLWRKNGAAIAGATSSTLVLTNVSAADAGVYSVTVSGATLSTTSAGAALTVTASAVPPAIAAQPVAQVVGVGGSATLTVNATGPGLVYQWRKDGVAIPGATNASLIVTNASGTSAGQYSVTVSNPNGSSTSNAVPLTVHGVARFGTFGGNGGTFALYVEPDRSGVFLGYASATGTVLVTRDITVDQNGHVTATTSAAGAQPISTAFGHRVAAATTPFSIDGTIANDGTLSGTVSGLNLTLSAPAATVSGTTATYAGFYQAGALGSSATTYAIVGADGHAYVADVIAGAADAGQGTISSSGAIAVTTASGATIAGTLDASDTLSASVTPAGSGTTPLTFVGANNEARTDDEKLINISARTQVGTGVNVLIAGFVVSGTQPKSLLIRAVGPTLAQYSIANPLSAAKWELFQGGTSLKVATDWSSGSDAAAIVAAGKQVGAFDLPVGSHDAAALVTLNPGIYSVVVSGQAGATGVGLVEVYDATVGAIPRDQRLINISSRGMAGTGENVLTAGFAVHGSVPKRVLIRGVGPSLSQYGVTTGYVTQPQVKVLSGATTVLQASGINAAEATTIATEAARVGAFPLMSGSTDTAVIVYLNPGLYTVQLSNGAGAAGIAVLEVYELP